MVKSSKNKIWRTYLTILETKFESHPYVFSVGLLSAID